MKDKDIHEWGEGISSPRAKAPSVERRAFLRKAGWAAPAIVATASVRARAAALSGGTPPGGGCPPEGG